MGLKTKIFIITPLIIFGVIVFGTALYMEICKNSSLAIIDC
jgi:hypothetical protein